MSNKSKEQIDNRSQQMNPLDQKFLDSRGCNLTQADVSLVQKTEVLSGGHQNKDGVGAEAQRRLNKIKNGSCSLS